jgi:hypothetical protein
METVGSFISEIVYYYFPQISRSKRLAVMLHGWKGIVEVMEQRPPPLRADLDANFGEFSPSPPTISASRNT